MQIAVLEGYTMPRKGSQMAKRRVKKGRRAAMKACAKKHKVTTRGFHACVRKKIGRK